MMLLWLALGTAQARSRLDACPDTLRYSPYTYLYFLGQHDEPYVTDEEFYEMSFKVIFPVNKYELPDNNEFLRQLADEVIPMLNRDSLELVDVMMRGAASPEGPLRWNTFLGEHRGQALIDFVNARLAFPLKNENFNLHVESEDYRYLCLMMQQANDPDCERVQRLCDTYGYDVAQLKRKLQAADEGRLWSRLLRQYFPELRASRIVFFVRRVQPQLVEVTDTIVTYVQRDSLVFEPVWEKLPRREFLSIKTNLLFDFASVPGYGRYCPVPNVAVEYYPRKGHFTFGGSFDFPWWQSYWGHRYFQIRNYQLETRYYFRPGDEALTPPGHGAAFRGWYVQAYAHAFLYGICFDVDRGWVGEGLGAGIGAGYVLPLSRKGHWRLEFQVQAGFFTTRYDPYQWENPVDPTVHDNLYYYKWTLAPDLFKKRQYRYNWLGPTRVGITLTYDLLYRRRAKKGISFISWEMQQREAIRHIMLTDSVTQYRTRMAAPK